MTKREIRLMMVAQLQLEPESVLWDIGAGTGTIPVECGLLCPQGKIVAIERDPDVVALIRDNCDRFGVANVDVIEGNAPTCLAEIPHRPTRVCVESNRIMGEILDAIWHYLQPQGRIVATANNLEVLYAALERFAHLQVRNVDVVQSGVNRLERRGTTQVLAAIAPTFILSGEKLD